MCTNKTPAFKRLCAALALLPLLQCRPPALSGAATAAERIVSAHGLLPAGPGLFLKPVKAVATGVPTGDTLYSRALYLVTRSFRDRVHRLDGVEIWHYLAGDDLLVDMVHNDSVHTYRLGKGPGALPSLTVPAHTWYAVRLLPGGRYSFHSLVVIPAWSPRMVQPLSPAGAERLPPAVRAHVNTYYPSK